MVQTIASTGGGMEKRSALIVHGIGLVLGAATMALLLFLIGEALRAAEPIETIALGLLGVLSVVWAVSTLSRRNAWYPRSNWQVPETWRYTLPFRFTAGAYGYLLGIGCLTDVVLPSYWVLFGLSMVVPAFGVVVLAWVIYAVIRWAWTWRFSMRATGTACPVVPPGRFQMARYGSALSLLAVSAVIFL